VRWRTNDRLSDWALWPDEFIQIKQVVHTEPNTPPASSRTINACRDLPKLQQASNYLDQKFLVTYR
jgi:hypothetical protein